MYFTPGSRLKMESVFLSRNNSNSLGWFTMAVFGWLRLVLIFLREKYCCLMLVGWCWFCVREKYCWLDEAKMKQSEKMFLPRSLFHFSTNVAFTITILIASI